MAEHTERERAILDRWPTITGEDITALNDLFPHYLFFRRQGDRVQLWTSCCGRCEERPFLVRTETAEHRVLLASLFHKNTWTCPWCGRAVTVIDLAKAGRRKSLRSTELAVVLHGDGEALYADAVVLRKNYAEPEELTAPPSYWLSSMYRFAKGEVMERDFQGFASDPAFTYEGGRLTGKRQVFEPFREGSMCWFRYAPYPIVNRSALEEHPFFRWCGFFDRWRQRLDRGLERTRFDDLISYLTAYAIYPRQVELLGKAGYWGPVEDLVWRRKKNAGAMRWEEEDARRAFGLDRGELAWFLGVQPPLEVLTVHHRVQKWFGKRWPLPCCYDFYNLFGSDGRTALEALSLARRYGLDIDRMMGCLDGQYLAADGLYYADLLELYRDYLEAAYHLGRCMEHSAVRFPPDLSAAHDRETGAWEEAQSSAECSQTALDSKTRREKYEFELDGLKILFPVTGGAIRREGRALRHCVGGYAERHLKGVLTILFLRRSEEPHRPYVTIEMQGNRIVQIHGWDDERTPCAANPDRRSYRAIHRAFLDAWLSWLGRGSPRNEDGTPKLPKKRAQGKKIA